jgi:hypothetical protein
MESTPQALQFFFIYGLGNKEWIEKMKSSSPYSAIIAKFRPQRAAHGARRRGDRVHKPPARHHGFP